MTNINIKFYIEFSSLKQHMSFLSKEAISKGQISKVYKAVEISKYHIYINTITKIKN